MSHPEQPDHTQPNTQKNPQPSIFERKSSHQPERTLRSRFIGKALPTADAGHETIGKTVGLAVFASDALSSNAYATQEILAILAAVGLEKGLGYVFPISIAIVLLLIIVTVSYEQIIHSYPDGGGAYIVARDNLGELSALIAASALLMDYILTVSVSISSGVAQIVSAFPAVFEYRVYIAVVAVFFIMLINLRGVRESGATIAIPSFMFIIVMFVTIAVGLVKYLSGSLGVVIDPPELVEVHVGLTAVTPFLLLHAFSSGTSALTGIEAISNGITAFKEPRSKNAAITLIWMSVILSSLFLGISFLSAHISAVPSEFETVISQLARTVFNGQNFFYIVVILFTTIILLLAANTAFAGFPRLSAIMAKDGFLPRQLTYRGSRLVYTRGIVALTIIASLLIILFQASVTRLIPLYAIGVFLSFTFSQFGMAFRWWRCGHLKLGQEIVEAGSTLRYDPRWKLKMVMNGFGATCTALVMLVFAVTKFVDGAYVVLILIPVLVTILWSIHRHYVKLAAKLSLENFGALPPQASRHRIIMPVSGVHQGSLAALRYARSLSDDVTALHVSTDPEETKRVREKWNLWGEGVRLVVIDSQYRLLLEPLLEYIDDILEKRQPGEIITIVVPEFVSTNKFSGALHTNTASILRNNLRYQEGIVITNVPYHVKENI